MLTMAMSVAFATGAATPEALQSELSDALNGGAPWKIVDYVLPEDRPPIAASFDMMAAFAAMDEETRVRLDAIHVKYGVLALDAAPDASLTLAETLARPYVNVTDFHGLCEDLWGVLAQSGEATGEPTIPKLKGGRRPVLKIGKQKLPLVEVSGRWFIDAPAPE